MIRRIQKQLGPAGLAIAVVALIAALAGTAVAAKSVFTKKQEKRIVKIAKQYAGKNGKNGANGAPGAVGPQGPKGDTGAKGETGKTGETGEAGICSAAKPECKLPTGATLVGAWGTSGGEGFEESSDRSLVQISFLQNVSPAPTAVWQFQPFPKVGIELKDGEASFYCPGCPIPSTQLETEEAWENACPGNVDAPDAAPGFVCIYDGQFEGTVNGAIANPTMAEAANEYGLVVPFTLGNNSSARGSWAVTAG